MNGIPNLGGYFVKCTGPLEFLHFAGLVTPGKSY